MHAGAAAPALRNGGEGSGRLQAALHALSSALKAANASATRAEHVANARLGSVSFGTEPAGNQLPQPSARKQRAAFEISDDSAGADVAPSFGAAASPAAPHFGGHHIDPHVVRAHSPPPSDFLVHPHAHAHSHVSFGTEPAGDQLPQPSAQKQRAVFEISDDSAGADVAPTHGAASNAAPHFGGHHIDPHVVRAHSPPPSDFLVHPHAHAQSHAIDGSFRHVRFGGEKVAGSEPDSASAVPKTPPRRRLRYVFPRSRDDSRVPDDDGVSDDIPLMVQEVPAEAFFAGEEAAELAAVEAGGAQPPSPPKKAEAASDDLAYTVEFDAEEPAVRPWISSDAPWLPAGWASSAGGPVYEAFNLRVVCEAGRTGLENAKDFTAPVGSVIAGRYRVDELLGSATFSSALACTDLPTGARVCLKVIQNNKDFVDQSLDEIKLLRYLRACGGGADSHHLLRLDGYFYHREHLVLVTELLKENLFEFQRYLADADEPPYYTLPRLQRIARQLLEALDFLASVGLLHCDIKPENILFESYSRCDVRLIDLGSSCFVTDAPSSYIQSRSYRAPEVILGLPYSPKIDVWSLGCVLAELHTGQVLFPNESVQTILARMQALRGPFPRHMLDRGLEARKFFTVDHRVYERVEGNPGLVRCVAIWAATCET